MIQLNEFRARAVDISFCNFSNSLMVVCYVLSFNLVLFLIHISPVSAIDHPRPLTNIRHTWF
jgi:hypothetical protein